MCYQWEKERSMDDAPVTRRDLEQILQALESRLLERIEQTETKLLTAFHGWARPHEIKLRTLTRQTAGATESLTELDERVSLLEERISRLERGDR